MSSSEQYRSKRIAIQVGTLVLTAIIGAAGIFRIDLSSANFVIFGHEIWWSNFAFTIGLGLALTTAPVITYKTIGIMWCGWACPQNAISEWANNLTKKMLGKRASVDIGETMQVAASKNKLVNWLALGLIFLLASIVLSIIPFLFFYSLAETWGIVTHPVGANKSTLIFYGMIVFMMFVNIVVVRHAFCDYACFYRIGQRAVDRKSPFAFVIAGMQQDPGAAKKLLETLAFGLVEIERSGGGLEAGGKHYPPGSYVIRMRQPYSSFAKTLLERSA